MRLTVTPEEFADIVVCFLFDKLLKPDEVVSNNNMFNELMLKMAGKGLKSYSMAYYLNISSSTRLNYKRIKDVFKNGNSTHDIRIISDGKKYKKDKEEKGGLIRKAVKIVKKLLKKEQVSKEELNILLETVEKKEE